MKVNCSQLEYIYSFENNLDTIGNVKSEKVSIAKQKAYLAKYIQDMKSNTPCMDCKISYPYYVMDFDHVRGRKQKNVSELISTLSKKKIDLEIAKCEIVCSNCHRIRTHLRKTAKRLS